jgi:hypothetical protein
VPLSLESERRNGSRRAQFEAVFSCIQGPENWIGAAGDGAKQEEEGEIERGNCRPDSVTEHDWALRRPRFF